MPQTKANILGENGKNALKQKTDKAFLSVSLGGLPAEVTYTNNKKLKLYMIKYTVTNVSLPRADIKV